MCIVPPPPDPGEVPAPLVNIRGERGGLGPIRRDLIPLYYRWSNDFAFSRTTARTGPLTLEQQAAIYYQVVTTRDTVAFVIYDLATEQPIGTTDLSNIDYHHGTATFSIGIGEAAARGKGFGTETTRLMLDYAFTVLGLHNIWLVRRQRKRANQP